MTHTSKLAITSLMLSTVLSSAAYAGNPGGAPSLLPSNPEAGECYARVMIPAQYRTETETVLVEAGYDDVEVTQAQFRSRQEQVLVKEASIRYEVRQPTFRTETENVLVRPAYDKLTVTPPKFSMVTESIQVSNPRLVWKKGNPVRLREQGYKIHSTADAGAGGRGYRSTTEYGRSQKNAQLCGQVCEIWCLVEEPGQSVTFNRKDLVAPSQVQRVSVPAKYTHITKQVVADPGGVREIPVPAQYRSVTVQDVVGEGGVRKVSHPARYGDVAKKVLVSAERYEWRRVVCAPGTHPNPRINAAQAVTTRTQTRHVQPAHVQSSSVQTGHSYSQSSGYSASTQSRLQPRVYGGKTTHNYTAGASYGTGVQSMQTTVQSQVPLQSQSDSYQENLPTYSEDYTQPAKKRRKQRYRYR